jgi:PAS domain S-box-containing protein
MLTLPALGAALCLLAFPLQAALLLAAGPGLDLPAGLGWASGPVVMAAGLALWRRKAPATDTLEPAVALAALRVGAGVSLLDGSGFVYANEAVVRSLGLAGTDEMRGRSPVELSPERQPDGSLSSEAVSRVIARAGKEGRCVFEWLHRRKDGTDLLVEITLVPVSVGGKPHLLNYWRDLTQVQQMRRERQQMLGDLAGRMDASVRRIAAALSVSAATLTGDAQGLSPARRRLPPSPHPRRPVPPPRASPARARSSPPRSARSPASSSMPRS